MTPLQIADQGAIQDNEDYMRNRHNDKIIKAVNLAKDRSVGESYREQLQKDPSMGATAKLGWLTTLLSQLVKQVAWDLQCWRHSIEDGTPWWWREANLRVNGVYRRIKKLQSTRRSILYYKSVLRSDKMSDKIIDSIDIQKARDYPIENLIQFKQGRARCINPAHKDSNPSMSLNKKTNKVKCFACNQGGDVIWVLQTIRGCSFPEAVRYLAGAE